jgi:hypothetical protein
MSTVDVGELVVRISGDVRKLVDAQRQSTDALMKIDQKAATVAATVQRNTNLMAAGFVAAAGGIAMFLTRSVQSVDTLNRLSQQTGVSVTALSELQFVAGSLGVEFSTVEQVIRGWNATLVEMSQNANGRAAIALRTLGLNVREITALPFDEVLRRVSDALSQYADGQNKANLATAIFKEGGAALIPVLNQSAKSIAEITQRGRDNGAVIRENAAPAAREYAQAMFEARKAAENLTFELGGPLLGAVTKLLNMQAKGVGNTRGWVSDMMLVSTTREMKALAEQAAKLEDEIAGTTPPLSRWFGRTAHDDLRATYDQLKKVMDLRSQALKEAGLGEDGKPVEVKRSSSKIAAPEMPNLQLVQSELDAFIDKLNGLPVLFGQAFAVDSRPYEEAMARIDAAASKSAVIAKQASRMKLSLQRQEQETILETASMAASTLTMVFAKNKGAAIASGLVNTAVGVTKALSASPPPYNFIQAGLVAAAGAAQIAAIRSTSQTGGGGSVSVGGGGYAGGDFGDESDVSSRANQTLFVQGIQPGDLLSGSMVRDIMERIIEAQRDDAQLVLLPQG